MKLIKSFIAVIRGVFRVISALYSFRSVFLVSGAFTTRKFPKAKTLHKYAVLVAARNEEPVISNLVSSIRGQDYPQELIDIFVVADNCTDRTAEMARKSGAVCYERNDPHHRTKGYALQFLINKIYADYGKDEYEGFFIFDADNLLKKDYISQMNNSFDAGEKVITSYRNTKNWSANWIAASYGIHWLTTARLENRGRSSLRLATRVQGTGYLFAAEVLKNGWTYTGLTEDREFCADIAAQGYNISYNHSAIFYDEQPTNLKIAMRQRIRWAKGHLLVLPKTGPKLLKHVFVTHGVANKNLKPNEATPLKRLINNLRVRFMNYDMLTIVFPYSLLSFLSSISIFILELVLVYTSANYVGKLFGVIPLDSSLLGAPPLLLFILLSVFGALTSYLANVLSAIYIFIIEGKRIEKLKWYKKVWYCLTSPMFGLIGKICSCIALFSKAEWKPIPHTADITIEDVNEKIHVTK